MSKILIVDDDGQTRYYIELLVKKTGIKVEIFQAAHGKHALEIMSKVEGFDLIISDVNMPEMDGILLTEIVKIRHPNIHVILMSRKPEPKSHKAHAFVTKPLGVEAIKKIKSFVDKKP